MSLSQQEAECQEGDFEEFARSPIYQDTLKLHTWINSWLDREQSLKDHPGSHTPGHAIGRLRRKAGRSTVRRRLY